ncbi:hypothetical protein PNOK_0664100 [Pyrrhoderma noxium]|uniref:Uncharacterized protein n=1 Tax=Pyrrhoderma noxium TaxID=2282107 RepID=A0A286UF81_9AGAM|nr:hypothetical protein PNOK_0664100 [Pyrrhoderma noxium]
MNVLRPLNINNANTVHYPTKLIKWSKFVGHQNPELLELDNPIPGPNFDGALHYLLGNESLPTFNQAIPKTSTELISSAFEDEVVRDGFLLNDAYRRPAIPESATVQDVTEELKNAMYHYLYIRFLYKNRIYQAPPSTFDSRTMDRLYQIGALDYKKEIDFPLGYALLSASSLSRFYTATSIPAPWDIKNANTRKWTINLVDYIRPTPRELAQFIAREERIRFQNASVPVGPYMEAATARMFVGDSNVLTEMWVKRSCGRHGVQNLNGMQIPNEAVEVSLGHTDRTFVSPPAFRITQRGAANLGELNTPFSRQLFSRADNDSTDRFDSSILDESFRSISGSSFPSSAPLGASNNASTSTSTSASSSSSSRKRKYIIYADDSENHPGRRKKIRMTENVREDVIYEELPTHNTMRAIVPLRQSRRNNENHVGVDTLTTSPWRPRLRDGFVRDSFAPEPEDRRRRRRDEDDEDETAYSQRRTRRNRRNIQNFTQASSFIPVAIHVHIPTPIIIPVSVPAPVNIPVQQPAPIVHSEIAHPIPHDHDLLLEEEEAEVTSLPKKQGIQSLFDIAVNAR